MKQYTQTGFSMIELMVALLLIGILTVMLTPVYRNYILQSNRSDAIRSLLNTQIQVEQYRINNTSYASTSNITSIGGLYNINVTGTGASAYSIVATATGTQTTDTECATITLNYANNTTTMSPSICWNQ